MPVLREVRPDVALRRRLRGNRLLFDLRQTLLILDLCLLALAYPLCLRVQFNLYLAVPDPALRPPNPDGAVLSLYSNSFSPNKTFLIPNSI